MRQRFCNVLFSFRVVIRAEAILAFNDCQFSKHLVSLPVHCVLSDKDGQVENRQVFRTSDLEMIESCNLLWELKDLLSVATISKMRLGGHSVMCALLFLKEGKFFMIAFPIESKILMLSYVVMATTTSISQVSSCGKGYIREVSRSHGLEFFQYTFSIQLWTSKAKCL